MTTSNEVIEWALTTLNAPSAEITSIVQTPWSSVLKINTGNELFYLKHTPKLIALEATIIQILRDQFHAAVPTIIANNSDLHCFIMKDAGRRLRDILKNQFNDALLCKAIDQFTSLQLAVADHVDVFLNIGVPDWRLNKLPELYKDLISQKKLLIEDGLSEMDLRELEMLLPTVSHLCKKLSNYPIKQTIVQPDFNDNNTLIDDISQNITIIDLGEISISHPFFSLINCLLQIRKHYGLTKDDDTYLRIKDVCLKNFLHLDSEEKILEAFATADILWYVYWVLAYYRLIQACGKEKIMSFQQGKLSVILKEFIALCKTKNDNNIPDLLNSLSDEVNQLYGYVNIPGDNFGEPAINSGPCGPFANAFLKRWNEKFTEKVNIVFIMVKNSDECWHILVRLPNQLLYDAGHGVHSEEKYTGKFDIEDMIDYDIALLEKRSYGLDRKYPRYCPNFSINDIEVLIDKYLNQIAAFK